MSQTDNPIVFCRTVVVTDSSTVDSVAFDPNTDTLLVTFNTGARYVYSPVTGEQFGIVVGADSVGKMLNLVIKENDDISFTKVD